MILAVAAAAILAVPTQCPRALMDAGSVARLSRSEPLETKGPFPAIDCGVPSARSMSQRREQKPQALPSHWAGLRQAVSVKVDSGSTGRGWYAPSGPRSSRAPPLSV
jgi:hypothetical protein